MTAASAVFVVFTATLVTYGLRSSVIVLLAGRTIPLSIERALRNVGPAVLAALVVSLAVGSEGDIGALDAAEFIALGVAAAVAWWRRSLLLTIAFGMTTLLVLGALI